MRYSGYELLWLFFLYSFLGWVLETVFAALKQKNFVNRGLITGPLCTVYGISAVIFAVFLQDLDGIWLFLQVTIDATVIEWIAGHLTEMVYHERWWNYSERKFNLDGYICLETSLLWGVLGFCTVKWTDKIFIGLFSLLPSIIGKPLIWAIVGIFIVDNLASYMLLKGRQGREGRLSRWEAANSQFANMSARLGRWISERVENRLKKAYPKAYQTEKVQREKDVFAQGCGFYKVVTLFFIAAFLGDLVETVWCRFALGSWMSRSSVVWGPFSVVWGIAVAAVTALLYKYKDKSGLFLFCAGTLLGGAYEYLCSVFTEVVFGKVFWDYSKYRFSLGGRINLTFCLFWGLASIVWFKLLYPRITEWIEKVPVKIGKAAVWLMVVFMAVNMMVSSMALVRYDERGKGEAASREWQVRMDEYFPDSRMEQIYPKAKKADFSDKTGQTAAGTQAAD